jgi:hypothetical protein
MAYKADVGFYDRDAVRHYEIFEQLCNHGEVVETDGGSYLKWSVGERLELWTRLKDGEPEMLFYAYYAGESRMRVALIEKMPRRKTTLSDGAFFCRGGGCAGADWVAGRNPFVFDTPHYHSYDGLNLPRVGTVQLTGFAYSMAGFENEDEYEEAYPADDQGYCWDYKHFIPALMLGPRGEGGEVQSASAEVSGWVSDTAILTNPVTGLDFCWARLDTIGGEVDVVCSPDRLSGYLVKGGLAASNCYLYGRLIEDDSN